MLKDAWVNTLPYTISSVRADMMCGDGERATATMRRILHGVPNLRKGDFDPLDPELLDQSLTKPDFLAQSGYTSLVDVVHGTPQVYRYTVSKLVTVSALRQKYGVNGINIGARHAHWDRYLHMRREIHGLVPTLGDVACEMTRRMYHLEPDLTPALVYDPYRYFDVMGAADVLLPLRMYTRESYEPEPLPFLRINTVFSSRFN